MKRNLLKYFAVSAAALMAAGLMTVQATGISGEVDMSGTVTLNNTSLGSASAATAFSSVTVGGAPTGNYAGTFGSSVTWSGFSWPSVVTVSPLWTFISGGNTFSFDLSSVAVVTQNNTFLNLLGSGTLKETGFANTSGSWSFTISNPTGGSHADFMFTFANSQTAAVPDGGTTVILLGAAISGLALLRKKIA
jgi:hypothetical protein